MSALTLRGVVKHYPSAGETVRAVNGVTLEIQPGEIVALYGPSGSGKTTLLLLAAGLMAPDGGSVQFGGRDIGGMSARESAHYRLHDIGFVFQSLPSDARHLGARQRAHQAPRHRLHGARGPREGHPPGWSALASALT